MVWLLIFGGWFLASCILGLLIGAATRRASQTGVGAAGPAGMSASTVSSGGIIRPVGTPLETEG